MTSLDALMLLIQHYPALTGEWIDVSALKDIERDLAPLGNLDPEDFSTVDVEWKAAEYMPSIEDYIESLRKRCEFNLMRLRH